MREVDVQCPFQGGIGFNRFGTCCRAHHKTAYCKVIFTSAGESSFLYLDEDRFGFNVKPGLPNALERATDAARRAIALNPEDVRALQALMMSLFLNKEHEEAVRIGERALAVNPNDTELMGELGSRVSLAGN